MVAAPLGYYADAILSSDPTVVLDEKILCALAADRSTTSDVLTILSRHSSSQVKSSVSANPRAPTRVLEDLAQDFNNFSSLASNFATPIQVLEIMYEQNDTQILENLASNESTPTHILEKLARHDNHRIHAKALQNRAMSPSVLQEFANSGNSSLRACVASNTALDKQTLVRLSQDKVPSVMLAALGNPSQLPDVLESAQQGQRDGKILHQVANNPATKASTLQDLAGDVHASIRECVAKNRSTPPEALAVLCHDTDPYVLWAAAGNNHTPSSVLAELSKRSHDQGSLNAVATNSNTSIETLRSMQSTNAEPLLAKNKNTPSDVLLHIASNLPELSGDNYLLPALVYHQNTNQEIKTIVYKYAVNSGKLTAGLVYSLIDSGWQADDVELTALAANYGQVTAYTIATRIGTYDKSVLRKTILQNGVQDSVIKNRERGQNRTIFQNPKKSGHSFVSDKLLNR